MKIVKKAERFLASKDKKNIVFGKLYPFITTYYDNGIKVINIPGFFNSGDILAYRALLKHLPPGSVAIEVGSWKGRSLANVSKENRNIYFISVDTFKGSKNEQHGAHKEALLSENRIFFHFLRNMYKHRIDNFSVLHLGSVQAANILKDNFADLVFIDAGHSYDEVKQDILIWRTKVKTDGILVGHDFRNENAVARAVKDTLGSYSIETFPNSSIWAVRLYGKKNCL